MLTVSNISFVPAMSLCGLNIAWMNSSDLIGEKMAILRSYFCDSIVFKSRTSWTKQSRKFSYEITISSVFKVAGSLTCFIIDSRNIRQVLNGVRNSCEIVDV